MRSRPVAVFLGLAVGLAARPGFATGIHIVAPAGDAPLIAGQLVRVSWDRLPMDVDEMELLLDMNAGAPQHLRLTAQLDGGTRTYLWRVPNLPATGARLRLRWGRDGVEVEGEPSAPFTIVRDPRSPTDGVRFRAGELWIGDPVSSFAPDCDDRGRVIRNGAARAFADAMLVETEVAPDGTEGRQTATSDRVRRSGLVRSVNPAIAAQRPLTIPLRT